MQIGIMCRYLATLYHPIVNVNKVLRFLSPDIAQCVVTMTSSVHCTVRMSTLFPRRTRVPQDILWQAGSTAASAAGWPSNPAANAADSDSDDDNPEERRKKKEEEWRAEKMRKLLEIAQSWDARVEESARKHKSLALLIEAKEEEKLRKAEMNQRKWMKATDPGLVAAATIEPVPPVQAGEDKYDPLAEHMLNDNKIKQVYSSSKILSKVKKKIINQEKEKEARLIEAAAEAAEEQEKAAEEATPKDGVIGSIQEYASLVGKTVKQMKEAQYEVPEESESEGEEEEEEGGDLWGAILGGAG